MFPPAPMTSTTAPAGTMRMGSRVLRRLPLLALILAVVALALLVLGPLGWRAGWWHYRVAFRILMPWSAYCGLAAVAIAILALALNFRSNAARHVAFGVIAFVIGGSITYVHWHYNQMRGTTPAINDITTDWENPPQFHAILPLREAEKANPVAYRGAKVSDLQKKAYPEIAPLTLAPGLAEAFTRALKVAEQMGWTIVATNPAEGRIEASQRSRWFGFTDDVVIRIAAAGSGSRVDIRSVSRIGRNDLGVNAARVRAYLARLREVSLSR